MYSRILTTMTMMTLLMLMMMMMILRGKKEEISFPIFLQNFVPPLDIIPIFLHAPLYLHQHLH